MRVFIGLLTSLLIWLAGDSQMPGSGSLMIGDTVPDLSLNLRKEGFLSTAHLRDFRGKLVILDFWGTQCASCIANMPNMLRLQTAFGDKIQVLLVTADAPSDIDQLWRKIKGHSSPAILEAGRRLSFVTGDSMISRLIPHEGVGMHAWIDNRSVYRAISYAESTTPANVNAFLTSGKAILADYFVPDIETADLKSWAENRTGFGNRLLRYSMVTSFDEKVFAPASLSVVIKKDSLTGEDIGLNCFNLPITDLYRVAYFKSQNERKYRVIVEADELKKYSRPHDEQYFQWRKANTYCYASKIPIAGKSDVYTVMQKDLDEFFDIESSVRMMPVKKYSLIRTSQIDRVRSSGGKGSMDIVRKGDSVFLVVHNMPVARLIDRLYGVYRYTGDGVDFVDETNYKDNIDISIPWRDDGSEPQSFIQLREAIRCYGLDLIEKSFEENVLVLREIGSGGSVGSKNAFKRDKTAL